MSCKVEVNGNCHRNYNDNRNGACTYLHLPSYIFRLPFQIQARRESNPQPPVLETGALPIELRTYESRRTRIFILYPSDFIRRPKGG